MVRVVVVGGGLAGLATAWFLAETAPPDFKLDVRVLERAPRPGGAVATTPTRFGPLEDGPIALDAAAEDASRLLGALGLDAIDGRPESKLALRVHGRSYPWPTSAWAMLARGPLSWGARARLLLEPFIRGSDAIDESVNEFATRRLGSEVAQHVVGPLVATTWGGDPRKLSARHALAGLFAMERQHGRIALAWLAKHGRGKRAARARRFSTFRGGLGTLVDTLAARLGDRVQCGTTVRAAWSDDTGYGLELEGGGVPVLRADVLVLAVAARDAARMVDTAKPDLAAMLRTIPSIPMAAVWAVWKRDRVGQLPTAATTMLAADPTRRAITVDAPSVAFPGQFSDEYVALRFVFAGKPTLDPATASDAALIVAALDEAAAVCRTTGEPEFTRVVRMPDRAQATLGHHGRLLAIDSMLRHEPNLFVTGSSYRGIGVDDAIRNGRKTAEHVVHQLMLGTDGRPVGL